ncbi:MAG: hypothetical protein MR809_04380 [Rikenellaceae bacterium]|nr:hypothetical protein [Rikenellaceae bacterium]
MKRIITTLLLLCSMLCIIPSCKKNSAPVEPEMPDVEGKLWFNLDKGTYSGYRFTGKTAEGLLYIKDEMQAKIYSSALKVSLQPGDVLIAVKYECKIVPETETSGLIMIKAEGEWQTVEYSELTDDSFKLQLPGEEEKLLSTPEKLGLEIKNIVEVPEPEEEAPEIEKVQARVKGREYISHLCQIMNNVEQEFEFVITPSDATAENVEVSSEDPIKWKVKSTSATGFTIIQNDEEGYCNEINFWNLDENKGYFTLQSLKNQSKASEFFKSWTLQINQNIIWYIEDGVAYMIVRDFDETSNDYVLSKVYEGFLDFEKSEDSCDYYTISEMFDRKTREVVPTFDKENDLQNIPLSINYKESPDAPKFIFWDYEFGTFSPEDRLPDAKIIEYLNTYCD